MDLSHHFYRYWSAWTLSSKRSSSERRLPELFAPLVKIIRKVVSHILSSTVLAIVSIFFGIWAFRHSTEKGVRDWLESNQPDLALYEAQFRLRGYEIWDRFPKGFDPKTYQVNLTNTYRIWISHSRHFLILQCPTHLSFDDGLQVKFFKLNQSPIPLPPKPPQYSPLVGDNAPKRSTVSDEFWTLLESGYAGIHQIQGIGLPDLPPLPPNQNTNPSMRRLVKSQPHDPRMIVF